MVPALRNTPPTFFGSTVKITVASFYLLNILGWSFVGDIFYPSRYFDLISTRTSKSVVIYSLEV